MKENPLLKLASLGQSIWIDFIRRGTLSSGELGRYIEEDGLRGVTSNPSIFEKAIAGSHDYDAAIRALALEQRGAEQMYLALAVEDIQRACDLFRPVYDRLDGRDGFVSLEVSPHLARDSAGTIEEARRLWAAVARPNAMIKVPATREGLPAIRQLTSERINVNVTLLFGLPRYEEVADAYLAGLEERAAKGAPLDRITSVASFFLSRIDVRLDPALERISQSGGPRAELAQKLLGQVAIASAKEAYQIYRRLVSGERFRALAKRGAWPQRLLWASTSTKNPAYPDLKYVEPLIGADTINTVPLETFNAYRDHGDPAPRLEQKVDEARELLRRLPELGIDLGAVTQQLEDDGIQKFVKPFDRLLQALEQRCGAALAEPVDRQTLELGPEAKGVERRLADIDKQRLVERLWRKDRGLWKSDALGWLHVAEKMEAVLGDLAAFAAEVKAAGFRHVVHLGMGGSSLAALAFERIFPPAPGALALSVLDTVDPASVLSLERRVPLDRALFIVASKSGTTAEPLALADYFFERLRASKGQAAGASFVAISDPGTPLLQLAKERGFRRSFLAFPDIGGRYSALSIFGLLPAALMGLDVGELLVRALRMSHACASCVPTARNPGALLGASLAELASRGRDKVTLFLPEPLGAFGMWLEQLLAESTGKGGRGLVPVVGEQAGGPGVYGEDRLFVLIRVKELPDEPLDAQVSALKAAGHPVITLQMDDRLDLAQEMFRWELATALCGPLLGINPFDQPDVEESKGSTRRLLEKVPASGKLPEPEAALAEGELRFYTPERARSASELFAAFFDRARPNAYVALQAFLPETPEIAEGLQQLRIILRDRMHIATTVGYGPRFLHSTGQLHKGGPPTGLFLQLGADDAEDLQVPDRPYTFGTFKRAQALADFAVLQRQGRTALRVHLGADPVRGLASLRELVIETLREVR